MRLRERDLYDVPPASEETIRPDYVRRAVAALGDAVVWLLAFADGRPVGRLGIDFGRKSDQGIVHLWAFGIAPELQRRGIGTAMIREAESLIASDPRGATLIEIGADEGNDGAVRL